jgi:hypothetical protein
MAAGWSRNAATLRQMAAPQVSVKSEIHMRSSPDFLLFALPSILCEASVNSCRRGWFPTILGGRVK